MRLFLLVLLLGLLTPNYCLVQLRGLQELKWRREGSVSNADPQWLLSGREAVGEGVKATQRLQLQLDRSDGRSDMTSDLVAEKYCNFISICLRSEGGAWTVPLGPLEYVGFKMQKHISAEVGKEMRVINLDSMFKQMSSCLIDFPTDPAKVSPIFRVDGEPKRKTLDLSLALVRLACRCALLSDQLEGRPTPGPFALALQTASTSATALPIDTLQELLRLDLGFEQQVIDSDGGLIVAPPSETSRWIAANSLGP
jgi:hypothetical protein